VDQQETDRVAVTEQSPEKGAEVMLSLRGLHKTFHPAHQNEIRVLSGVDLDVHRGEVVAMIGPSGSGKSTALRCINLLETPDAGTISLDGEVVFDATDGQVATRPDQRGTRQLRQRIGMVFQGFHLFPTMSVLENITMPQVRALGRDRAAAETRGRELLGRVGLAQKADSRPRSLSGGQQQRVAIARAVALEPEIMLFDEPTSAIDPELRIEVLRVMRGLAESGMTMIVVTHEMSFAEQVADRIVFFDHGVILESGPPAKLLRNPEHDRVREFLIAVHGDLGAASS
jgi:ABC-type polar amino acid transport system ATPase subunit